MTAIYVRAAAGQAAGSVSGIESIDFSSMALSLGLVVAVIVAAAFLLKRSPLGFSARGSGPLKLVATLPLGPRERLLLVTSRGREILVGVSPAGVSIAPVPVSDPDYVAPAGMPVDADEARTLAAQFRAEPST